MKKNDLYTNKKKIKKTKKKNYKNPFKKKKISYKKKCQKQFSLQYQKVQNQ